MKHCQTLTEQLTIVAKENPQTIALQTKTSTGYETYTYQEIYHHVQKIAEALIKAGLKKNDRVAIVLENRAEWAFVYFGILFAGGIAVPLDPMASSEEMTYFFNDSEAKIVFTSLLHITNIYRAVQKSVSSPKIVLLDDEKADELIDDILGFTAFLKESTQETTVDPQINPEDLASILYTSGTTGKPKGVMLSHKNFYSNFQSIEKLNIFFKDHDNMLAVLPLHHSFPFMVNLLIPLFLRIKVTYVASLKREQIIECMQETGITFFVGVPLFFNLFYQTIQSEINKLPLLTRLSLSVLINIGYKLRQLTHININKLILTKIHSTFGKKLRYFISGGAKLDRNVETFFKKLGFSIVQGYGLTETAPVVAFNPLTKAKIGSVGKPIPEVMIKIINQDENGIGEVIIAGPNVMQGYYKHEKETEETLKNGWFYSGDLGYFDRNGFLFLTGRIKELIILGSGKNIAPEDVENHYVKSPYIKELCVLAAGEGDKEALKAVIVPDFFCFKKTGELNFYETIKLELEKLSKNYPIYKTIMGFVITKNPLPRTNLGKLTRHKIRAEYLNELTGKAQKTPEAELAAEDLALLSLPIFNDIANIITTQKQPDRPLSLHDHLSLDLGFDSLTRIELISTLEKKFNVQIPESVVAKVSTIKDLVLMFRKASLGQSFGTEKVSWITEDLWQSILSTDPAQKIVEKIDISPSLTAKAFMWPVYGLFFIISKLLWRIEIKGTDNLPKDIPFIICPNHASFLDAFLVLAAIPRWLHFKIFFLGLSKFFEVPIIRHIIKIGRIIPLDLAHNLLEAMRASSYVLRHKRVMAIFPEGGRTVSGSIEPFKKGVGILASELNVPLIPVYIEGAYNALPINKIVPSLTKIKVTFGKPYLPEKFKTYEEIAKELEEKVKYLSH
jgi:long-chain acyl-CoA synthetase